ncbi:conserved hypothetical protein [Xanthomonas citri pv. fuscans]|nr:conserved hypothetical protein [Xanthomonas citri pv. fuscans]SOO10314.1 conserved hypothetical protein [Xanthomonas citri pv. fuscans]SOO12358.1 conserved hypothetical protein [Xanthomonas citri pv. fuscans]SOO44720.1 conserved hypothetical protein [Xanthomonas citri pv. fuscans]
MNPVLVRLQAVGWAMLITAIGSEAKNAWRYIFISVYPPVCVCANRVSGWCGAWQSTVWA